MLPGYTETDMSAQSLPFVVAIVPAAGRSGRMGTLKQLLDVDGRPMVLGVVATLLAGGVRRAVVVVNEPTRIALAERLPPGVALAVNPDPSSAMIDSIRLGLVAGHDGNAAGYVVCPCDAVGLTACDVRRCVDAFATSPDRIVIATHSGRRGHPMIFPASLTLVVQSAECDPGLNHLARNRPHLVREVECDSAGTVENVNTRADYDRLR